MDEDLAMDDYMEDSLSRPSLRSPSNVHSDPATVDPAAISTTTLNGSTDPILPPNFAAAPGNSPPPQASTSTNTSMGVGENNVSGIDLNISPEAPKADEDGVTS